MSPRLEHNICEIMDMRLLVHNKNHVPDDIVHAVSTCPRKERGTPLPLASCVEAMYMVESCPNH